MVTPTPEIEVVNAAVFPDEEFIKAARQVNNPDFTGYEFYMETMGVTFYRKYREARVTPNKAQHDFVIYRAPACTSTRCTE